jgi:hypothetical protein
MALWTAAKDIRLTWTQSRTTSRIAGVGFITGSGLARGERLGTQISKAGLLAAASACVCDRRDTRAVATSNLSLPLMHLIFSERETHHSHSRARKCLGPFSTQLNKFKITRDEFTEGDRGCPSRRPDR